MITSQDITKLKTVFATHKDMKDVKKDIKDIKGDIKDIKKELKNCVTKKELKKELTQLREEMKYEFTKYSTREELQAVRSELVDRILTSQDLVLGAIENMRLEMAASNMQLNRHNGWINELADHTQCKLSA